MRSAGSFLTLDGELRFDFFKHFIDFNYFYDVSVPADISIRCASISWRHKDADA
jgi:hypothetical protein